MSHDENEGGFVSHLAELRKRLIHSFIFLIILLSFQKLRDLKMLYLCFLFKTVEKTLLNLLTNMVLVIFST